MVRCLVVDDDPDIRSSLQQILQRFDMAVDTAASGNEMRRSMATESFDVVILDLMLPDANGLTLCKWVHETSGVPVIILTGQGDPTSRVLGLEIGADDYLEKPVEPRELVARIHAVLRRAKKNERAAEVSDQRILRFAGWYFDRALRQLVSPDGVVIDLSNAEFRLMSAFVENPEQVLTRDQLIDMTRTQGADVNDRSIDLCVSRLRQKLGDSPKSPQLIRTLRSQGYVFSARVRA